MKLRSVTLAVLTLSATIGLSVPASSQTLGMVGDSSTNTVTVFDDATGAAVGSVAIPGATFVGDCSVAEGGTEGFVTDFSGQLWVIDLTGVPQLAAGPNPIPISNHGIDTSIDPGGQYLVTCGGALPEPISVVDIRTRTEVSTFHLGHDCTSVAVCDDGSVVVGSFVANGAGTVRRLLLDELGTLTDTGDVLALGAIAQNVFCSPGSASSGVVVFDPPEVRTFEIPGLAQVSIQGLSGAGGGNSAVVDLTGGSLFTRTDRPTFVDGFGFDAVTGVVGAPLFAPIVGSNTLNFFGMDQIALNPENTRLYASVFGAVNVYDPVTGGPLGQVLDPNIVVPTGICFERQRADQPPRGLKEEALEILDGLLPTCDSKADKEIRKAVKEIEKSLDDDLWLDDSHLTDQGKKVFEAEKKAAKSLLKVLDKDLDCDPAGEVPEGVAKALGNLVLADHLLAAIALEEAVAAAQAAGCHESEGAGDCDCDKALREIEKAEEEIEKALAEIDRGKIDKAIDHYKRSWEKSQKALDELAGC